MINDESLLKFPFSSESDSTKINSCEIITIQVIEVIFSHIIIGCPIESMTELNLSVLVLLLKSMENYKKIRHKRRRGRRWWDVQWNERVHRTLHMQQADRINHINATISIKTVDPGLIYDVFKHVFAFYWLNVILIYMWDLIWEQNINLNFTIIHHSVCCDEPSPKPSCALSFQFDSVSLILSTRVVCVKTWFWLSDIWCVQFKFTSKQETL